MWGKRFEKLIGVYDPLMTVALPLVDGLTRHGMLRLGVAQAEVLIQGIHINYYKQEHHPLAAQLPPVLLIHGLADNALTWALTMPLLAQHHDVYALDLPGYGFSELRRGQACASLEEMRDVLRIFLHEVIGGPAVLAGNSLGGWLAVKLAWAEPALVRGVALLNAGGAPLAGRASWDPFREIVHVPDLRTARRMFRQLFGAIPAPLLYMGQRGLQAAFQRQVVREFVAIIAEDEFLQPNDLRCLPVPAALLWGISDTFLPAGSLEFFRENMPNALTLLLNHCGHLPQRERPRSVARFIHQFAGQCSTS